MVFVACVIFTYCDRVFFRMILNLTETSVGKRACCGLSFRERTDRDSTRAELVRSNDSHDVAAVTLDTHVDNISGLPRLPDPDAVFWLLFTNRVDGKVKISDILLF